MGISNRVLHMDNPKPIYTLLLLQFVVGISDHVLYCVHRQPETTYFKLLQIVVEISDPALHMDNTKPIYTPLSLSSCGRNVRAGSTLYGILNIKWRHSSIAHVNHYYIGL